MSKLCEIIIWNVQHGNSVYIHTNNNRHIAIDAGIGRFDGDMTFSPLEYIKNNNDIKKLDYAIITHPHKDHIDDISNLRLLCPKVLSWPIHLKKDDIITSTTRKDDIALFDEYLSFVQQYNNSASLGFDDPRIANNYGGIKIECFSPKSCSTSNINNHSIIAVLYVKNIKIIFPGDNEDCSFNELFKSKNFIEAIQDSDILVAPHHGRANGYNETFIKYVNPKLTIISDSSKVNTSVATEYSKKSKGMKVFSRKIQGYIQRNTVSTYNDGIIRIKISEDSFQESTLINVNIK